MKSLKPGFFLMLMVFSLALSSQNEKKIKNVILMIPDGTSTSVLSLARWYKNYCAQDNTSVKVSSDTNLPLALDPYLCGLVKTHSSNSPIGDSAPTSSWYATGQASRSGYVAMYPPADPGKDLVEVDIKRAYQPLVTVLEAAKLRGKKTGLVFTCQFPHATPADFSAHHYNRDDYPTIAKQMVYNNLDVVFGGGTGELDAIMESALKSMGHEVLRNDMAGFRKINMSKLKKTWALFDKNDMPFDFDRDPGKIPSLAEMTQTAIEALKNETGFFLMVEGSKVDWAAHGNDIVGMMSEFMAFDKAVDVAIKFAEEDRQTVVIICPDHGTGGPSMGNLNSNKGYGKLSLKQIFEPFAQCGNTRKATPAGIADTLVKISSLDTRKIQEIFNAYFPSVQLTEPELNSIMNAHQSFLNNNKEGRDLLVQIIVKIIAAKTFIGFTTTGHTGEDVFLAIYNPDPSRPNPHGLVRSDSINRYICQSLGLTDAGGNPVLRKMTDTVFVPYHDTLKSKIYKRTHADSVSTWNRSAKSFRKAEKIKPGSNPSSKMSVGDICLNVDFGKESFIIPANKNFYFRNDQKVLLNTVVVWVDKAANGQGAFYLPKSLVDQLK
jgi:alkaline phosphatase